ncbi:hypothetical protein AAMO2058_000061300 [Amorphochlora amoebiformis]
MRKKAALAVHVVLIALVHLHFPLKLSPPHPTAGLRVRFKKKIMSMRGGGEVGGGEGKEAMVWGDEKAVMGVRIRDALKVLSMPSSCDFKRVDSWLMRFQRSDLAWSSCVDILLGENPVYPANVRLFCAQTLRAKAERDSPIPADRAVDDLLAHLKKTIPLATEKIDPAVSQDPTEEWDVFVQTSRAVAALLVREGCKGLIHRVLNDILRLEESPACVEVFRSIPEELSDSRMKVSETQRNSVLNLLKNDSRIIFSYLTDAHGWSIKDTHLEIRVYECAMSWIRFIPIEASILVKSGFLRAALRMYGEHFHEFEFKRRKARVSSHSLLSLLLLRFDIALPRNEKLKSTVFSHVLTAYPRFQYARTYKDEEMLKEIAEVSTNVGIALATKTLSSWEESTSELQLFPLLCRLLSECVTHPEPTVARIPLAFWKSIGDLSASLPSNRSHPLTKQFRSWLSLVVSECSRVSVYPYSAQDDKDAPEEFLSIRSECAQTIRSATKLLGIKHIFKRGFPTLRYLLSENTQTAYARAEGCVFAFDEALRGGNVTSMTKNVSEVVRLILKDSDSWTIGWKNTYLTTHGGGIYFYVKSSIEFLGNLAKWLGSNLNELKAAFGAIYKTTKYSKLQATAGTSILKIVLTNPNISLSEIQEARPLFIRAHLNDIKEPYAFGSLIAASAAVGHRDAKSIREIVKKLQYSLEEAFSNHVSPPDEKVREAMYAASTFLGTMVCLEESCLRSFDTYRFPADLGLRDFWDLLSSDRCLSLVHSDDDISTLWSESLIWLLRAERKFKFQENSEALPRENSEDCRNSPGDEEISRRTRDVRRSRGEMEKALISAFGYEPRACYIRALQTCLIEAKSSPDIFSTYYSLSLLIKDRFAFPQDMVEVPDVFHQYVLLTMRIVKTSPEVLLSEFFPSLYFELAIKALKAPRGIPRYSSLRLLSALLEISGELTENSRKTPEISRDIPMGGYPGGKGGVLDYLHTRWEAKSPGFPGRRHEYQGDLQRSRRALETALVRDEGRTGKTLIGLIIYYLCSPEGRGLPTQDSDDDRLHLTHILLGFLRLLSHSNNVRPTEWFSDGIQSLPLRYMSLESQARVMRICREIVEEGGGVTIGGEGELSRRAIFLEFDEVSRTGAAFRTSLESTPSESPSSLSSSRAPEQRFESLDPSTYKIIEFGPNPVPRGEESEDYDAPDDCDDLDDPDDY